MTVELNVNDQKQVVKVDGETPLLWVLRENLKLTGTKFGCGLGACGACTVHLNGKAARSCVVPVSAAEGLSVRTIEGLSAKDGTLSKLQAAWIAQQVPQCGYCQSGMLMAAAALLAEHPSPTDEQIDAQMTNLCRCGTYPRIKMAIRKVARGEA